MKEKLVKMFKLNNGYLLSKQIQGSTLRYHLSKMVKNGEVSKIKQGLYVLNGSSKYDERELAACLVPDGVFCMFSAWHYYELTTTVPRQYYMALHRNTRAILPDYPPVKLYLWSDKYYSLGISEVEINGVKIKYYDLERSVCDAVKFRNKVGNEITTEVLKSYVKRKNRNIDLLMKYAKQLRIEKIIAPLLQTII